MEAKGRSPRLPPLPPPPRAWRLAPSLFAGVLGTGLLYDAATQGGPVRLALGAALFALGLAGAGYPFVLAMTWRQRSRHHAMVQSRPEGDRPGGR